MTKGNAEIIKDYLTQNAGRFFCNKCLSELTGVTLSNQVNQVTRPLRGEASWVDSQTICSSCQQERLCIRRLIQNGTRL